MLKAAWQIGVLINSKKGTVHNDTLRRMMAYTQWAPPERVADGLRVACEWSTFEDAVAKSEAKKGVGADGFNAYLLRKAPRTVREEYWKCMVEMIQTRTFPAEWQHLRNKCMQNNSPEM